MSKRQFGQTEQWQCLGRFPHLDPATFQFPRQSFGSTNSKHQPASSRFQPLIHMVRKDFTGGQFTVWIEQYDCSTFLNIVGNALDELIVGFVPFRFEIDIGGSESRRVHLAGFGNPLIVTARFLATDHADLDLKCHRNVAA